MSEYASLRGKIHNLIVDNTLSIRGAVADAKAIGDAIAELRESVGDIELPDGANINEIVDVVVTPRLLAISNRVDGLNEAVANAAVTETHFIEVNLGNWMDGSPGYWYTYASVPGMLATDNPIVDVVLGSDMAANELYKKQWGMIDRIEVFEYGMNIYATDAPVCSFAMQVKVVR